MIRHDRVTAAFARNSPISAQKFLAIVIGTLTVVGLLSGFVRWAHRTANSIPTRAEVDSLFVKQTTFTTFRLDLELQHQRDSLISDARAVRAESKLDALVADCRRRGGCL